MKNWQDEFDKLAAGRIRTDWYLFKDFIADQIVQAREQGWQIGAAQIKDDLREQVEKMKMLYPEQSTTDYVTYDVTYENGWNHSLDEVLKLLSPEDLRK